MKKFINALPLVLVSAVVFTLAFFVQQSFAANKLSGEELWNANCGKCHALRAAPERSDEDWAVIMSQMRVRAGLTGEEAKAVLEYLQSLNDQG